MVGGVVRVLILNFGLGGCCFLTGAFGTILVFLATVPWVHHLVMGEVVIQVVCSVFVCPTDRNGVDFFTGGMTSWLLVVCTLPSF